MFRDPWKSRMEVDSRKLKVEGNRLGDAQAVPIVAGGIFDRKSPAEKRMGNEKMVGSGG